MMRKYKTLFAFRDGNKCMIFQGNFEQKKTLEFFIVSDLHLYIGSNAVHHAISFLKHLELELIFEI